MGHLGQVIMRRFREAWEGGEMEIASIEHSCHAFCVYSLLTVCSVGDRTDHVMPAASVIRNLLEVDALAFILLPVLGI